MKNAKMIPVVGNVCSEKKFDGKVIKYDDAICEEYEFGGFIELAERLVEFPEAKF